MKRVIFASRASQLAVVQTQLVIDAVVRAHPDIEPELLTLKTTGDRILDRPLDKIGGKGLFVRELNAALRERRADFAVHSCKDLPAEIPEDLPLCAFTRREDPRDALVLPVGKDRIEGPIGCSSLRRQLQLQALYPDLPTVPVRGNVLTRLQKLDHGEFGALVLAAAGLKRLGLADRIHRYFTVEEMLPAAGQGILAVQCRQDDSLTDCVNDRDAACCARAERAFIRALDGGCSSPVAAHAVLEGERTIKISGLFVDENGRCSHGTIRGIPEDGESLGIRLAGRLKEEALWQGKRH